MTSEVSRRSRSRQGRSRHWLWELWGENRSIVKAVLADFILFLLFLSFMEVGHHIIAATSLGESRKEALETVHFYLLMFGWIVLGIGLLLELTKILLGKLRQ